MDASIWDQILSRVETKVNRHSFYTWFKPTTFVADSGSSITVRVPNPLFKDWLTKHYSLVLSEALAEVRRSGSSLVFVAEGGVVSPPARDEPAPAVDAPGNGGDSAITGGFLNARYTFDTFIVGPSNQFAHAACRAVAEAPSRSYNPLFIYGGVGLGKTHLMHAIGQDVLQHDSSTRLTYISSERFMNEMINALRYDRILEFRERYRSVDILLVDDIQFVSGKEGTQTEFFHTFNALYDAQKQIVLSSDHPPHEIPALDQPDPHPRRPHRRAQPVGGARAGAGRRRHSLERDAAQRGGHQPQGHPRGRPRDRAARRRRDPAGRRAGRRTGPERSTGRCRPTAPSAASRSSSPRVR